jgi:glutaminase
MKNLLKTIIDNNKKWASDGKVASYIPELMKANPDDLGICVSTLEGEEFCAGEADVKFTIQSISKVITLMLAILDNGKNNVFSKIDMEPTETGFNSIINLETSHSQKPINPMINAGAIAIVSMISGGSGQEMFDRILKFSRKITGNPYLDINEQVYLSEKNTGHRNRSLAYFMKSTGVIEGDVDEVLDVYFKQCSIEANCRDIARIGVFGPALDGKGNSIGGIKVLESLSNEMDLSIF